MAAKDLFLKIDGIDGESQDDKHKGEIEVIDFVWSAKQAMTTRSSGGGGGAGAVSYADFVFKMGTNKASPKLMLACSKGDHIKTATLTCRKAGGGQQEYYTIKMSDVIVSNYQTGTNADGVPEDQIALNFTKLEVQYNPQKADGSLDSPVKAGYDISANKPV